MIFKLWYLSYIWFWQHVSEGRHTLSIYHQWHQNIFQMYHNSSSSFKPQVNSIETLFLVSSGYKIPCSFVPDILYLILSSIIVANSTFVCKKKVLQYHQTRLCPQMQRVNFNLRLICCIFYNILMTKFV